MNAATLALCLCLSIAPQSPPDAWFAEDKLRHFFASFAVTTLSASVGRAAGLDVQRSALAGVGAGSAFGVWKELRDHRAAPGSASFRDLVWDLGGVGAGYAVMRQVR